jgi:hypothetical protein
MPSQICPISGWIPPWFQAAVGSSVGVAEPKIHEPVVRRSEHGKARRPGWVRGDHVQQPHLDWVGQRYGEIVETIRKRVDRGQL